MSKSEPIWLAWFALYRAEGRLLQLQQPLSNCTGGHFTEP